MNTVSSNNKTVEGGEGGEGVIELNVGEHFYPSKIFPEAADLILQN